MTKRVLGLGLALALAMVPFLTACGSSGDNESDSSDQPTVDGDTDIDRDVVDSGTNCGGICVSADGFYCDAATQTCLKASAATCTTAEEAYYCGKTQKCVAIDVAKVDYEIKGNFCLTPCATALDCSGGFSCQAVSGTNYCVPTVYIATAALSSKPGEPCEYGSLWPDYACRAGDSCVGNATPTVTLNAACTTAADCSKLGTPGTPSCSNGHCEATCATDADCATYGLPNVKGGCVSGVCGFTCTSNDTCKDYGFGTTGYCASGLCGFAFCVTPCMLNGECPDLGLSEKICPGTVSGSCYCGTEDFFPCTTEDGDADTDTEPAQDGDTEADHDSDTDHDSDSEAAVSDSDSESEAASEECTSAADCTPCQSCSSEHKCVANPPACAADTDCNPSQVCDTSVCGGTCRAAVCGTDFQCDGACQDGCNDTHTECKLKSEGASCTVLNDPGECSAAGVCTPA